MTSIQNPQSSIKNSKVAIVTGAGSGVGRATAMLLAEVGYRVVLVARTEANLNASAQFIREQTNTDAELFIRPTDVTDPAAVDALVKETLERFGQIDALANVAGSAPFGPLDQFSNDDIDACLATNLKSVIYLTRACWPTFTSQKSGAICNVSSMASVDPFTGFSVYGAAKAGVNIFTKATSDEGKPLNITACAVAPGAIETPMLRENFPEKMIPQDKTLDPALVAGVIRDTLTGKRGFQPGECIMLPSP